MAEPWSFKKAWADGWIGNGLRYRLKDSGQGEGDVQYFWSREEVLHAAGHWRDPQEEIDGKWYDIER